MAESFGKDDTFRPFSNGHEFLMWQERNCWRGEGGCRNYKPTASSSRDGCPIEVALALAGCIDGEVKVKHGLRGGFLEPGQGGRLEHAEGDPSTWRCPEYRGYDEPDDRPRRGPQPPSTQLDLLDPRNEPVRDPVLSASSDKEKSADAHGDGTSPT